MPFGSIPTAISVAIMPFGSIPTAILKPKRGKADYSLPKPTTSPTMAITTSEKPQ